MPEHDKASFLVTERGVSRKGKKQCVKQKKKNAETISRKEGQI